MFTLLPAAELVAFSGAVGRERARYTRQRFIQGVDNNVSGGAVIVVQRLDSAARFERRFAQSLVHVKRLHVSETTTKAIA